MIKLIPIILIATLSGCATTQIAPPTSTIFTDNIPNTVDIEPIVPLDLPTKPGKPKLITSDGTEYAGFSQPELQALKKIIVVAEANTLVAQELAKANTSLLQERSAIVALGRMEEDRANYFATRWARTQEDLEEERKSRLIEKWGNRIIMFALGILFLGR